MNPPVIATLGHGTHNDFLVFFDPDDQLLITQPQVAAMCNRTTGIGADGIIRIIKNENNQWFMDYRNADGSLAEMCGNGIRVMARYLVEKAISAKESLQLIPVLASSIYVFLPMTTSQ